MTMRMKWKEMCKACLPITSERGCDFQWDKHAQTRPNKQQQLMWMISVNYSDLNTDIYTTLLIFTLFRQILFYPAVVALAPNMN